MKWNYFTCNQQAQFTVTVLLRQLLRFASSLFSVNEFRSAALALTKSHFSSGDDEKAVGRVEFLPVNWHRVLHGETTGVDRLNM